MRFRLKEMTKNLLADTQKFKPLTGKKSEYYNSKEFYAKHPDLAPRNIYLSEGRIITQKEWDKTIRKAERQMDFEIFVHKVVKKIKNCWAYLTRQK